MLRLALIFLLTASLACATQDRSWPEIKDAESRRDAFSATLDGDQKLNHALTN